MIFFSKRLKIDKEFLKQHSDRSSELLKKTHKRGKIKYDTFSGKKHSEKTKNKMRDSHDGKHVGNKNSQFGTCWITKNGVNKKIKKVEFDKFEKVGWSRGRKQYVEER